MTEQDTDPPEESLEHLRARAEAGDSEAQCNLGLAYADGVGVPQDDVQAHMWRNLAASRQTGEERKTAADARDALARLMTRDQIAEAQRLARGWDEAHPR